MMIEYELPGKDLYVILWSPQQQCWHVEKIDNHVTTNLGLLLINQESEMPDWIVVYITQTRELADAVVNEFEVAYPHIFLSRYLKEKENE